MADVFSLLASDSVDATQSGKERLGSLILNGNLNSALEYGFHHTRYSTVLGGCAIFRTEGGSLGMGSEGSTKDDDVVCHLAAYPKPIPTPPTPRTAKC